MINLVKNELMKIFHKKGTYITLFIFIAFLVLINCIVAYTDDEEIIDYDYSAGKKEILTNRLQELDPANDNEIEEYVSIKTEIDNIDFVNNYDKESWQRTISKEKIYEFNYNINKEKYILKDDERLAEYEAALIEFKSKLDADDWRSFVNDNKTMIESEISNIKKEIAIESNTARIDELSKSLEIKELELEIAKYRLENNITYTDNYLNRALQVYEANKMILINTNDDNQNKENIEIIKDAKERIATQEYILKNKVNIEYEDNARNIFSTVIEDNIIFFVIFIVLIAGAIMAEEFSRGTIKSLLTKPFTRTQIFISKYIASILMLLVSIIVITISQYIIGGICFGFDSYKTPMVVYNYTKEIVTEIPMLMHIINSVLAYLPMLLMLLTLAIGLGTIFTNTALATTLTLFTMFFHTSINMIISSKNIAWLNYFPTMIWNLSYFMYGNTTDIVPFNAAKCLVLSIIYIAIMIFIIIFIFKRKNVKNI